MIFGKPRVIALDTSQYVAIIRDLNSTDSLRIRRAREFQQALVDHGCAPLFTFHHISELLKHRDTAVGRDSIVFIRSLAAAAWIPSHTDHQHVGAVTDILAAEAAAALTIADATAEQVCAIVAKAAFKLGSGEEAVAPYLGNWQQLQPHLWEREEKAREIMALSNANFLKDKKRRVSDILHGKIRPLADANRMLEAMRGILTDDLQKYGDKKLSDPTKTATEFLNTVKAEAANLGRGGPNAMIKFLEAQDIDLEDLQTIKRPEELGELSVFRKQLKIVAETVGVEWPVLKRRIKPSSIPSWVIQNELHKNRDPKLKREGSELVDRHLACLAAYADITYVDKRIHENVLRARRKSKIFSKIIGRIEKVSHYSDVINYLK